MVKYIYMSAGYASETKSLSHVKKLVRVLSKCGITHHYLNLGRLDNNGILDMSMTTATPNFVNQVQLSSANQTVIGWINSFGEDNLENPTFVKNTLCSVRKVLSIPGINGLHINFEPFWTIDNPNLYRIVKEIRDAIGPETFLSMASPCNEQWTWDFINQLSEFTTQLDIMAYDTGITVEDDYLELIEYNFGRYEDAVARHTDVGVTYPSYKETPKVWHEPDIENIVNVARSIKKSRDRRNMGYHEHPGIYNYQYFGETVHGDATENQRNDEQNAWLVEVINQPKIILKKCSFQV